MTLTWKRTVDRWNLLDDDEQVVGAVTHEALALCPELFERQPTPPKPTPSHPPATGAARMGATVAGGDRGDPGRWLMLIWTLGKNVVR